MANNPFPGVTVPAKPAPKGGDSFSKWAAKNGIAPGVAADARRWAAYYHLNPYYFASLLKVESGADPHQGINAPGQAVGIAQIAVSWIGKADPFNPGQRITRANLDDYNWNLRFGAWYAAQGVNKYGYQDAYLKFYNPADPNRFKANTRLFALAGKYLGMSTGGPTAPPAEQPPPSANIQAYTSDRLHLDSIYLGFVGRRATKAEVLAYEKAPKSDYQIQAELLNPKTNPRIFKSPVWATFNGLYDAYYRSVFGPDKAAPKGVILYAILHNLDATAFTEEARTGKLPGAGDYATSEEYKGHYATAQSIYTGIYGMPDDVGKQFIDHAVRKGWNGDQIEQTLRAQPEYTQSGEYKARAIDLASRMGLIQGGAQTVLAQPSSTPPGMPTP